MLAGSARCVWFGHSCATQMAVAASAALQAHQCVAQWEKDGAELVAQALLPYVKSFRCPSSV
jgi:predicted lipoprotein